MDHRRVCAQRQKAIGHEVHGNLGELGQNEKAEKPRVVRLKRDIA